LARGFDRDRFASRLGSTVLGRELLVRETTASTNDDAWEALPAHGHGVAVVALAQTRGRGRSGRGWVQVPGKGLALSVALRLEFDARHAGLIPLAAGLAAVEAAHALGAGGARLKWPNDVLARGRKLAGVLCEVRRAPAAPAAARDAVVIGLGMNVGHAREDFPDEIADTATSLALEGAPVGLEDAAATFLGRLEPLWAGLCQGARPALLAEWSRWMPQWDERLTVRTPAGLVAGVALRLDTEGGLVLRGDDGLETTVLAGDVMAPVEGRGVA